MPVRSLGRPGPTPSRSSRSRVRPLARRVLTPAVASVLGVTLVVGALAGAVGAVGTVGLAGTAQAAGTTPADPSDSTSPSDPPAVVATTLVLEPGSARAGIRKAVRLTLTDADGPVAGASVLVERRTADGWSRVAEVTTGAQGHASARVAVAKDPARNRVRATFAGDETHEASSEAGRIALVRQESRVRVSGPGTVVDGRRVIVRVRLVTRQGAPLVSWVRLQRRVDGRWRNRAALRTNADGIASVKVSPRSDSRWRAVVLRRPWIARNTSPVHTIDNLPPGTRVRLPAAAPEPRRDLPRQRRAVGKGANPKVTRIPEKIWASMVGNSWHYGCPVGRPQLRLLRINYWGYDGYRYRGTLVANADVIGQMAAALAQMYRNELPIRSMYRVDRFGWSSRVQGADDYASMAAGNTSAFNCRHVVGRPGVTSPHAYGRALDVNTWENPFRSSNGLVPNSWWQYHSHPRVAWRSSSHEVVKIMARHGLAWTYGLSDTQHFDAYPSGGRRSDAAWPSLPRVCSVEVCD
ncbi:M15 family metallopeptidase [Nocardioides bruguierae]|uniref:M15 family metallopeptidase n=1 Tax=Nocardioides bruguierae TaxID=2945102 RepID=UPI00201FD5F3|nr:M15 family metallopeptidase [Nocardioides bruguierae]MCL8025630.1 M15 family metallopeptidase [Nocardioides bruguierae]